MKTGGFTTSDERRGHVNEAARTCKFPKQQVSKESVVRVLYEASSQTEFAAARINDIG
jgi:hypothetical protein